MLIITSEPIGKGRERICYVHPEDPHRAIKIPHGSNTEQTRRDIAFYRKLEKRGLTQLKHVPSYYGWAETNLGKGIVVDLIRNCDGQISASLKWHLNQGVPIMEFEPCLEELRESFLKKQIIFNHDMVMSNLLVQKISVDEVRLIVIDGLGDTVAIDWLDNIPWLVRRKIRRRWERFIAGVYRSGAVRRQREAAEPQATLEDSS
jgi:hypothetical protein